MNAARRLAGWTACALVLGASLSAQERSVKPGINDAFKNPDAARFEQSFEVESREVYAQRKEILKACALREGMSVADVGAGTGLFVKQFAPAVGPRGKVYAVEIAQNFLDHIQKLSAREGFKNVETVLCRPFSVDLPDTSVDLVFICDTYHHFEFPFRTLESISKALRPGGKLVVVDFERIPGKSREWILGHVRAGKEIVTKEIEQSGFRLLREEKGILAENYLLVFEKKPRASGSGANP